MLSIRTIDQKDIWENFIERQKPSTFLHAWAWGEAEAFFGRSVHRRAVYDGERIVAVVTAVVMRARRGDLLIVPHGPVVDQSVEFSEVLSVIKPELARIGRQEKCVVVRVCPIQSDTEENREIYNRNGFRPAPIHVYSELSWILDIRPDEGMLLAGMKKNTRYGIRKGEKDGITITSSGKHEDLETFWNLYSETARRQSFVPFPKRFVYAEFEQFAKDDRVRLYFADYQGEIISTAFVVLGPDMAFYHHGASLHKHHSITPGEILQWHIIKDLKSKGLSYYDFWGVLPEDNKKEHAWSRLDRFKRGFGGFAQGYVHAQDLPLSSKYWITYCIETIRRWKRNV